jgi:hypothetical protein
MKIGFVVHFFDFRNDVRKVISLVAQSHEVVLFVRPEDEKVIRSVLKEPLEIRLVNEKKPSVLNKIWELLFRLFGQLPKSRSNYYLMEIFKLNLIQKPGRRKRARRMLEWSYRLPKWMSYDFLLNRLSYKAQTPISDIDRFVCFTEISDSYFFSRLIREERPVSVYVYSWDHPCKHLRFSKRVQHMVWNEGLKDDMVTLQGFEPAKVSIIGASQFGYIQQFLNKAATYNRPYPFKYLYFGCALGIPPLVPKELEVVQRISALMQKIVPDWKLVVRPYPVLTDWKPYNDLKQLSNVVLDDGFRQPKASNLAVSDEAVNEKMIKIHYAEAFLHLGTTLGLEAAFTETPSMLVDFNYLNETHERLSIRHFIHQFQNDKYLNLAGFNNVLKSESVLAQVLEELKKGKNGLLPYNHAVRNNMSVQSFEQFANRLLGSFAS